MTQQGASFSPVGISLSANRDHNLITLQNAFNDGLALPRGCRALGTRYTLELSASSQVSTLISHNLHKSHMFISHDRTQTPRRTPVHAARMQVKSWRKSLENKLLSQRKGSEGETQHLRRLRHTSSTLLFLRDSVTQTGSTHTFCDNSRHFSTRGTRCRRSQVGSSRRGNRR